jgi:hypothetical protein
MSAADTTDIDGVLETAPEMLTRPWFIRLGTFASIGFLLLLVNFPKFLGRVIDANVTSPALRTSLHAPIEFVQASLAVVMGEDTGAFFERAMTCSFVLLWMFIVLLAIFCMRRRGIHMLSYGLGGAVVGYLTLHILAWAAVALVLTIKGVLYVTHWAGIAIATVVGFLFGQGWPLLLILAIGGAGFLISRNLKALIWLLRRTLVWLRKYATFLLGGAGIVGLLWLLVPFFYRYVILPVVQFVVWLLSPVVQALLFVFKWLVTILFALFIVIAILAAALISLALLGSLLVAQLQAGWHAARSLRHILIAGFAIGSALALIVVESVATPAVAGQLNHAWIDALAFLHLASPQDSTHFVTTAFQLFLPQSVETFVFAQLTSLQAPAFDSLIFLAVTCLAALSVLFRVFSTRPIEDEYVPMRFVVREYATMVGGLFVALVVIFLGSLTGDSHTT